MPPCSAHGKSFNTPQTQRTLVSHHKHTHFFLQVTLTAAGTAGQKAKITVKSAAFGAADGANLVQTIFSDYAPSLMPVDVVSGARTG